MAKKFRVVVFRDYAFGEDNEIEQISRMLEIENIPHEIIADDADPAVVERHRADIVIIDYGGIASMGAWDTALFNIRYVLNWAEDHPSTAMLIWSSFTANIVADGIYEKEIDDAFSDAPANVFNTSVRRKDQDRVWDLIRAMIGATKDG